jgi:hypothetical protein
MNWDAIGAIAELLGALGVIGSLVYVALQVRSSTRASKVESKLRLTEAMVAYGNQLLENPELNDLMIKGRKDIEELSKEELLRFSNLCLKAGWYISSGYFMYRQKTISEDDWFELRTIAEYWAYSTGFQQWWASRGHKSFTGDFKKFIDQQIYLAKKLKTKADKE